MFLLIIYLNVPIRKENNSVLTVNKNAEHQRFILQRIVLLFWHKSPKVKSMNMKIVKAVKSVWNLTAFLRKC